MSEERVLYVQKYDCDSGDPYYVEIDEEEVRLSLSMHSPEGGEAEFLGSIELQRESVIRLRDNLTGWLEEFGR